LVRIVHAEPVEVEQHFPPIATSPATIFAQRYTLSICDNVPCAYTDDRKGGASGKNA
jgi:hypothetical protein